jgi:PAS domain S-box-containing protein
MRSRWSIDSPPWLTAIRTSVAFWQERAQRWLRSLSPDERRRLQSYAVALGVVLLGVVSRGSLDSSIERGWLLHAAIASAAATGVATAPVVAILASLLVRLTLDDAPLSAQVPFLIEAAAIAFVVLRLSTTVDRQRRRMAASESLMIELKTSERRSRRIDAAFSRLEEVVADTFLIVLDRKGRITEWRSGAARQYGRHAPDVLGSHPSTLYEDLSEEEFASFLAEARQGGARHSDRHRRGDGTTFAVIVDLEPLSRGGIDGFTMTVRDLTTLQQREAAASASTRAFEALQDDAETAQRELAALRYVTDPAVNTLAGNDFVAEVLERLRGSIEADGIALVQLNRFRRSVICAPGGLQCQRGIQRPLGEIRRPDASRTLMLHNDPAGVAEVSAAGWPDGVTSLISVPVVRGGAAIAVMEVVNRSGQRATEAEIALVQVVAARVAGFVQEDAYADSGAVA